MQRRALVEWSQLAANITIVVGLLVAVFTYLAQVSDNKIDISERRLDRFHGQSLVEARSTLSRLWDGQDLSSLRQGLPRKAIDALVDKTIAKTSIPEGSIDEAILLLTDYLDGVGNCRHTNHCDYKVIDLRLGQYAHDFFCIYRGRVATLREKRLLPVLGVNLAKWAGDHGGCGIAPMVGTGN